MSSTSGTLPDSIFTWVFEAFSGDQWGGWLVEDSQTYVVGSTLATANGTYRIVAEEERGTDLAGAGLHEGAIAVAWYRDAATAAFLVTRNGAGSAVGSSGLGSEIDAAWNGTDWVEFGRGGAAQVDGAGLPDSLFTWVFTADSGDLIYGTLLADSDGYAVGDTLRTAHGSYRILTESVQTGSSAATGLVHVTRYYDSQSRRDLTLESGGTQPAGTAGLGSELDRVWDGLAWRAVGQGGAWQADAVYSTYTFTFIASSGDSYTGLLFELSAAYAAGDTVAGAAGYYRIDTETVQGTGSAYAIGTLWLGEYFDAGSGLTLRPYRTGVLGLANTGLGLGNEVDQVWDGDNFDQIGRGGQLQADVERFSLFRFTFLANSGDFYNGWYFARADEFDPGDTLATAQGHYRIDTETSFAFKEALAEGTVWLDTYYDSGSGVTAKSWRTHTLNLLNPNLGLGNEVDQIWDGDNFDQIGRGGQWQADVEGYSLYTFTFHATSGDRYTGWLFETVAAFGVGDTVAGVAGHYSIDAELYYSIGAAVPRGSIWLFDYFDAASQTTLKSYNTYTLGRLNPNLGLGNEVDQVLTGAGLVQIGRGGQLQANVEGYSLYTFTFHAQSGDRYTGWLFEDTSLYTTGDTLAGAQGYYRFDAESYYSRDAVVARGTIWLFDYFDLASGRTMQSYTTYTLGRTSPNLGLGNEVDQVWDGDNFDQIGRGGQLQSNVEGFSLYTFTFQATSGDRYTGWLFENTTLYTTGDTVAGTSGYYRIDAEQYYSPNAAVPAGTIWLFDYFDAASGQTLKSHTTYTLGQTNRYLGLGNEVDQVWDGDSFDMFGRGGQLQANVEGYSLYLWTFHATSRDRYTGWLYETVNAHSAGDTVAGAAGYYKIDQEIYYSLNAVVPAGTIWLFDYFDAASGQTMQSYTMYTLGRTNPNFGLGNEVDQVWDGDNYDQFGRGGLLQSNVEPIG